MKRSIHLRNGKMHAWIEPIKAHKGFQGLRLELLTNTQHDETRHYPLFDKVN